MSATDNIKSRAFINCKYNYAKIGLSEYLMDIRLKAWQMMLNDPKLMAQCSENKGSATALLKQIDKSIFGNTKWVDISSLSAPSSPVLAELAKLTKLAKESFIWQKGLSTSLVYREKAPIKNCTVYINKVRSGGGLHMSNVILSEGTSFLIDSCMHSYQGDSFSVSFCFENYGIIFKYGDSATGMKGVKSLTTTTFVDTGTEKYATSYESKSS